jgi:hypothetical protein
MHDTSTFLSYEDGAKVALMEDLLGPVAHPHGYRCKGGALTREGSGLRYDIGASGQTLEQKLVATRIFCLSKDELYFLDDSRELLKALNHRNEAAALSLLQQRQSGNSKLLLELQEYCEALWPQFHHEDAGMDDREGMRDLGKTTEDFISWAAEVGIQSSSLVVGSFPPLSIRGCMAERDVSVGEDILTIPKHVLLYDETVLRTDLGKMLSVIPGLSMDNLLIIFTMIDRFDDDSFWKPFWKELPEAFKTGLSFPPDVLGILKGSSAYEEIRKAQAHIKNQYDSCTPLFDMLLTAYPAHLSRDWFTYERYVWSVELWYSYAFEVEFPPNTKSKTVMVPFACLVNHSPWPHVVRYGRMDGDVLRYPAFRPCQKKRQVFISYGPVPNVKLICYYGFSVRNNPHDCVPVTLELPEGCSPKVAGIMERRGLSLDHNLREGSLSVKLKACLRVLVATDDELKAMAEGRDPLSGPISHENEAQATETLRSALRDVHGYIKDAIKRCSACKGGELERQDDWVLARRFCMQYLEQQERILAAALK